MRIETIGPDYVERMEDMDSYQLYWGFAVAGSVFFLLRTLLFFVGFDDGHAHGDVYHDTDTGMGTEGSFHILSLTSLSAFIMAFGWAGLAAREDFHLPPLLSLLVAISVGGFAMIGTAYLFRVAYRCTSSGASYSLEEAIGKTGEVYERIPAEGWGRIQINVGGMVREVKAVAESKQDIDSFKRVQVVRVVDQDTVAVAIAPN